MDESEVGSRRNPLKGRGQEGEEQSVEMDKEEGCGRQIRSSNVRTGTRGRDDEPERGEEQGRG